MPRFDKEKRLELERQLRPLIETQALQQSVVAAQLGVSEAWVHRACKRLKLSTQRTGPRSGALHPRWRDGTYLHDGYLYVYSPDHPNKTQGGYVAEHRLIMERMLGRFLERKEVVHHKDKNTLNNELSNLELFASNAEHLRHELTGCVPNWTEEGRARTLAGVRKPRPSRRK